MLEGIIERDEQLPGARIFRASLKLDADKRDKATLNPNAGVLRLLGSTLITASMGFGLGFGFWGLWFRVWGLGYNMWKKVLATSIITEFILSVNLESRLLNTLYSRT